MTSDWTLPDVWLLAADFCTAKDLARLSATCRTLRDVARTPALWRCACEQWAPGMAQFAEWAAAWQRTRELRTRRVASRLPPWGRCFYPAAAARDEVPTVPRRCLCLRKGGAFKSQDTSGDGSQLSETDGASQCCDTLLRPRVFQEGRKVVLETFLQRLAAYTAPRGAVDWHELFHQQLKEGVLAAARHRRGVFVWGRDSSITREMVTAGLRDGFWQHCTLPSASAVLPIDHCRLIWRVAVDELLERRAVTLHHDFGRQQENQDPDDLVTEIFSVCFKVKLALPYTESDEPRLEFWARNCSPGPFGGFQLRLVCPASQQLRSSPAQDTPTDDQLLPSEAFTQGVEDVVGNVWTTTGIEWGWNSLVNCMRDFNAFVAPGGFLYFDVRWFAESLDVANCVKQGVCSYRVTGPTYTAQEWFLCHTCELTDKNQNGGCCSACATACHAGHDVRPQGVSASFCDCGGGDLRLVH